METSVRLAVLAFFALRLLVEGFLLVLNLRHAAAAGPRVPGPLAGRVSAETAARSLAYTQARGRLAMVGMTWGALLTLALLFSGILPWFDAWLARSGLSGAARFMAFYKAFQKESGA